MKHKYIRYAAIPLLTGVITFCLYLLIYWRYGIFPCGSNTIVWCDMEQQAVPLLVQLRQIFQSGGSIRYTVLDAGGMQYYGIFFFFLSNPLSLLILISDIPANQLVGLLVIIKLALSASTAALWLRYRVPKIAPGVQILLGMMYGCCGYGMLYYQNLMWLDVMAMMPLMMIALRILLKKEQALPYFLCLCATMLLCFYICYMVVLFVMIYMILSIRFTVPKERRGAVSLRFWAASAIAACATAFVWLPCFLQVMHSAREGSLIDGLKSGGLLWHFFDKFCLFSCTALGITVLPMLLRKKRLKTGAGKRDLGLLIALFTAALLDPVNKMWHTGSYQAFPMRWGMIPVLLMLTLAAQTLTAEIKPAGKAAKPIRIAVSAVMVLLPGGVMAAICLFLHSRIRSQFTSYANTLWFSIPNGELALILCAMFICCYGLTVYLYRRGYLKRAACIIGCAALFAVEFAMYFDVYPGENANEDELFAKTLAAEEAFPEKDGLARLKMTKKYAHANMVGAIGMPTMAHYTSLTRADYLAGVKRFGYSSYWMEVSSAGGTLLTDLLWHVQYQLGQTHDFPSWTKQIWTDDKHAFSVAEMQLLLPSALYTDAKPDDIAELPGGSRAGVQRVLAERMLGITDAVQRYEPTEMRNVSLKKRDDGTFECRRTGDTDSEAVIIWEIPVKGRQALYFDLYTQTGTQIGNPRYRAVTVRYNTRTADRDYPEKQHNGIVFLGEPENQTVTVTVNVQRNFVCESFGVFGLDEDALEAGVREAKGTALSYRDGTYTAKCSTDAPKTLVMPVAYDEGFTATVNGKEVPVSRVNACQTAVQIPAGESTVQLKFHVQGLRAGILIAAGGLLLGGLWLLFRRRILSSNLLSRCAVLLMQAAWCGILLIIYCMPVVLCCIGMANR